MHGNLPPVTAFSQVYVQQTDLYVCLGIKLPNYSSGVGGSYAQSWKTDTQNRETVSKESLIKIQVGIGRYPGQALAI